MVVLPPSLAAGENGPVKVGTLTPEELFAQLPGRKCTKVCTLGPGINPGGQNEPYAGTLGEGLPPMRCGKNGAANV